MKNKILEVIQGIDRKGIFFPELDKKNGRGIRICEKQLPIKGICYSESLELVFSLDGKLKLYSLYRNLHNVEVSKREFITDNLSEIFESFQECIILEELSAI